MKSTELTAGNIHPLSPGEARNEYSGVHRIANAEARAMAHSPTELWGVPETKPRRACLVLVEDGAGAHASNTAARKAEQSWFITQSEGEPSIEWAQRVIQGVSRIQETGTQFERAVVLVAARFDSELMTARHVIARALLNYAKVSGVSSFEIVLEVPESPQDALRDGILTLAELLVSEGRAGSALLHVRFGDGRPRRGSPGEK